jgi:DNA-directed RNA polymerase subunit beta'
MGQKAIQRYVIQEVKEIYAAQGEPLQDKHVEVIIRQMLSRVKVVEAGDTDLLPGDIVEKDQFEESNLDAAKVKEEIATGEQLIMGITKVALSTESFLSAASFQETARVLINAAVTGKDDRLRGLKENVIIGRLIPAGTGYRK